MPKEYIISIDLGTTGNRVYCFDEYGQSISSEYREFTQYFPKPGWVEHDPFEIWDSIKKLIPAAIKKGKLSPYNALSIGITNQRETTVIWDKESGKPIYNAIVWQCRRTSEICSKFKNKGYQELFQKKTGLVIDAYFSGTKIKWILDNVKGAKELARKGKILFGTIDSWILWNLSGGKSHKTDFTNASRTLIFNIVTREWDKELLEILKIPENILPEVQDSASLFGETYKFKGLPDGTPICGIAGDQQAAMVGQNCVKAGTIKNTYGTGCFMVLNTGSSFINSKNGLLTTLCCDPMGKPAFAVEGSVFIAGAAIQWLRDYMKFFKNSSDTEKMALSVKEQDDVIFIPAFVGLGAPYWEMDARGAIFGLTRGTTIEQIVRSALKSIAFQSMDVIEAMQQDTGSKINQIKVDGGATKNKYLMQFQADIMNIPVLLPGFTETTALGAAYLAGLTSKMYKSIDNIAKHNKIAETFKPVMPQAERESQKKIWKAAIKKLIKSDI